MGLIELWFGAAWLGAVLAPINTGFRGSQLHHALILADPALIVTDRQLLEHLRDPMVRAATAARICITSDTTDLNSDLPAPRHCPRSGNRLPLTAHDRATR